jgi:hypothetical protein
MPKPGSSTITHLNSNKLEKIFQKYLSFLFFLSGDGQAATGLVGIEKCIFVPSRGALGFPLRSTRAVIVRVLFWSFACFGLFQVLFLGSFVYFLCT